MIQRSQRSFKELIDSFEDAACAVSLDGLVRNINKRVAGMVGMPYTAIVGHDVFEFIEEPTRSGVETSLGRFTERKHWAGTVRVVLKNNTRPLYFDCVLNGILKSDEVVGVSVLGRDVTEQREKELRFTELFETLQEGVYFSTPNGNLLDANPALVGLLVYEKKGELLSLEAGELYLDPGQPPVLGPKTCCGKRSQISKITPRNWPRSIMMSLRAGRFSLPLSTGHAIAMEAGAPCGLRPANFSTLSPN